MSEGRPRRLVTDARTPGQPERSDYTPAFELGEASQPMREHMKAWLDDKLSAPAGADLPDPHPEATCEECGQSNICWFAPSDLWNQIVRADRGELGDPMLCPMCFVRRAEAKGIMGAWLVTVAPPILFPDHREITTLAALAGGTDIAEMLEEFLNPPDEIVADIWRSSEAHRMPTEVILEAARGIVARRIKAHVAALQQAWEAAERERNEIRSRFNWYMGQIEAVIGPIRSHRSTGEPAQSDFAELRSLTAQLAETRAEMRQAEEYMGGRDIIRLTGDEDHPRHTLSAMIVRLEDKMRAETERAMRKEAQSDLAAATQRAEQFEKALARVVDTYDLDQDCVRSSQLAYWRELLGRDSKGPDHA